MRVKIAVATALAALAAASAATAAPRVGHGTVYSFFGQLSAAPANGQASITVQSGNRAALRAMLGQPVAQTFAYGDATEFLKWADGIPTVVHAGDLASGDYVWIHVRDSRDASLADIEKQAAGLIGDHGTQIAPPTQPLYEFRGTLTATGANSVTLNVASGNSRAMRLLVGQPASETFTTGSGTIFLLWQGKVPTVISLSQLKVGDKVVVRVRADKGSTLAQVESTAAIHVGDREPASKS